MGFKVWKNIGMSLKDPDGRYVMLDDPRFEPVFARMERDHIPLLAHQAEPLNCWLPFDDMTVRGDREYFQEHPQYYMYQHPEMPSHDAILAARDRMIKAHPALRVDAVHLASLEWDVDRVAQFLDTYPNANVDLAARLVHLEYQATTHPAKVRRFLIRYQDRILYGSDDAYGPDDSDPEGRGRRACRIGSADWQFLATSAVAHSPDFAQDLSGNAPAARGDRQDLPAQRRGRCSRAPGLFRRLEHLGLGMLRRTRAFRSAKNEESLILRELAPPDRLSTIHRVNGFWSRAFCYM